MAASRAFGLARQFSTSASREALARAPIQLFGIEGRYAHAIYSAATKKKCLDAVHKELKAMQVFMQKDVRLWEYMSNPSVQRVAKREGIMGALKKQKFSDITVNFFGTMAENGRLGKAPQVLKAFDTIMLAEKGIVLCTVTTAKALEGREQKDLESSLNGFLKKGETMEMTMQVDPSLLGGMTVSIGDKFVDMSIIKRLNTYKRLVQSA